MAEQDLDINIEVAREADIIPEGHDLDKFPCKKNGDHSGFIPLKELKLDDLPEEVRNEETLKTIKNWGRCVVRLVIDKIRDGERVKEAGTGIVVKHPKFHKYGFLIQTNHHVVGTDDDVKHCTVEFLYDSHDRSNLLKSKGVKLEYTCMYRDISFFKFELTKPVLDFLKEMDEKDPFISEPSLVIKYKNNDSPKTFPVKSIPNSTLVYFHTAENINDPQNEGMSITLGDKSISRVNSHYFEIKPIPPNIQDLDIEIRINEDGDDSNSYGVIPGKVVRFGDTYVVKISEPIFDDQVSSPSTRLNFKQVTSRWFYRKLSGIDFELHMYEPVTDHVFWEFDLDGKGYACELLCCIGHPHGGKQMVTFGRLFGRFKERFDKNQKLCKHQPGEDCDCKEVSCLKYTCKTCKGSSGSPIFIPHEMFNINNCAIHFSGKNIESKKHRFPNGELIENENMAWG